MKNLLIVVQTQCDFIKIAQFKRVAERDFSGKFDIKIACVNSSKERSDGFYNQFNIAPDYFLDVPIGPANKQIARGMLQLESVINQEQPDLILVSGDGDVILAASLTAKKMNVKLAHTEGGLRTGEISGPREMNRILTDEISEYLFVSEECAMYNLNGNGKKEEQLFFVGNTIVDTMIAFDNQINACPVLQELGLKKKRYVLVSLQNPGTISDGNELKKLVTLIQEVTGIYKVILSIDVEIVSLIKTLGLYYQLAQNRNVLLSVPNGYVAFQKLVTDCKFIITNNNTMQEVSTFRRVPCLTLCPSTMHLSTIKVGTNTLVPYDLAEIRRTICAIKEGRYKKGSIPEKWDGNATHRILEVLDETL